MTGQPKNTASPEAMQAIANGCSGGITWFYRTFLGRDIGCQYCCDEHDLAYHDGGSAADRALADYRFWACMVDSGRAGRAFLFWLAVRCFGWAYWTRQ